MGHLRNDIKRSEGVLEKIGGAAGLTEAGKEWVIAAFDPFHDRDIDCTGFPDISSGNSMLQVLTLDMQVSAPASVVASGVSWDCHIVDWPFLGTAGAKMNCGVYTASVAAGTNVTTGTFAANNTSILPNAFGGLGVYSFLTSANNVSPFLGGPIASANLTPSVTDLVNPYRVIAKGFEVYNTTEELHRSGSVCVYSQPVADFNMAATGTFLDSIAPASFGAGKINLMDAPPQTTSEALRLPSSRQWKAEEGCYVISKLHKCDIPVHLGDWTIPMYYNINPTDATMYAPAFGVTAWITGSPVLNVINMPDCNWTNFDQDGAIFSGLSPQTTLTINYRMFIYVFFTSSSALSYFANPSPIFDRIAIEFCN